MPNCIWTCRQERFGRRMGGSKLLWQCPNGWDNFQKQKYRSCSKMPNCIWTCRQGRLLAAFTIQSFCFGAADALEMRGSITIHWGRWTLCMNTSEIPMSRINFYSTPSRGQVFKIWNLLLTLVANSWLIIRKSSSETRRELLSLKE